MSAYNSEHEPQVETREFYDPPALSRETQAAKIVLKLAAKHGWWAVWLAIDDERLNR